MRWLGQPSLVNHGCVVNNYGSVDSHRRGDPTPVLVPEQRGLWLTSNDQTLRLPMSFFVQRRVGELVSRMTVYLAQIQAALTGSIPQFLGQSVVLVGGRTLMTMTSGRLTLVMLASVPVIMGMAFVFGRFLHKISRETHDRLATSDWFSKRSTSRWKSGHP